jgi:ParB-like chromosome segregation protein Spo0J
VATYGHVHYQKRLRLQRLELLHHEGDEGKARRGLGEIQELVMKSPVYNVQAIPVEKIQANTYNPNHVAPPEMKLLYDSIKEDGYTMPIVCYYLPDVDKYEIVDGFHRYTVMLTHKDIYEREGGKLPVVVIEKDISNRMASTVRHNRARGTHDVDLMANIVKELREAGMKDAWIMKHLGMDADELLRLKQITGLAALFKDREFSTSWDI